MYTISKEYPFYQITSSEDVVEVVKAISPDDDGGGGANPDQVALESIDSDGSSSIHLSQQQSG